jgi:hypothetical protein
MSEIKHSAFRILYRTLVPELATVVEILPVTTEDPMLAKTSVTIQAIWDTGATKSVISHGLQKQLKLIPIRKVMAKSVNHIEQVSMVEITVKLTNEIIIPRLEVAVSELNSPGANMLIGMDIISQGDFCISNFNAETIFSFAMPPFKDRVDLFEKSSELNKEIF